VGAGFGVGDAVGFGVATGAGVAVGLGITVMTGAVVAFGDDVGFGVAVGLGASVGATLAVSTSLASAVGLGVAVGTAVSVLLFASTGLAVGAVTISLALVGGDVSCADNTLSGTMLFSGSSAWIAMSSFSGSSVSVSGIAAGLMIAAGCSICVSSAGIACSHPASIIAAAVKHMTENAFPFFIT